MYIKRNYGFWMTFRWSQKPFLVGLLYSAAICALGYFFDVKVIIPWNAVTVIGIAVAFYLGFKNNSSYDRTWEARKIWGGIVNSSRSFGVAVIAFLKGDNADDIKKELIYRHVAWLTALRYQLRLGRTWEHTEIRMKGPRPRPSGSPDGGRHSLFREVFDDFLRRMPERSRITGRGNQASRVGWRGVAGSPRVRCTSAAQPDD